MRTPATALAALFALAGGAEAQTNSLADQFILVMKPCTEIANSTTVAPANIISTCESKLTDVSNLGLTRTLTQHEDNVFRMSSAMGHSAIASNMGRIDGARTKRTCEEIELGWWAASGIKPADSPQEYRADMTAMRDRIKKTTETCRKEFPSTVGWAPLD